jgi:T4-like virus tail tube protein gp19
MGLIPTSAGRFHLELDGKPCGFVDSLEGGGVAAEVVTEPHGGEHYLKKHLGNAAPEPIVVTFGLGLDPGLYDWLAEAWNGNRTPRDGRIVFVDATLKATQALEFQGAVVTSVTFPKLDALSKDPGRLTVVLEPEETRSQKASEALGGPSARVKQWISSNFRVEVDGLDSKRVAKVDAFTVVTSGDPIDFPRLRVTISETGAESWRTWHEEFVVKGHNDEGNERSGALVLLDATLKEELGRVALAGLGIYRLAREKTEASADTVARVVAELYCERMELAL